MANREQAPLRVLLARPEGQEQPWLDYLAQQGMTAENIPALSIEPVDLEDRRDTAAVAARQYVLDLDHYTSVICVSANAARCLLQALDSYWVEPPQVGAWYAVGRATAEVLREGGLAVVAPEQGFTSEGLLALPELQAVNDERLLIVRGVGGRDALAQELNARGGRVSYCELYRRGLPLANQVRLKQGLAEQQWDAVVASSGAIVNNLQRLAGDDGSLLALPLFVPSERVAKIAWNLGFKQIIVFGDSCIESVGKALHDWYSQRFADRS